LNGFSPFNSSSAATSSRTAAISLLVINQTVSPDCRGVDAQRMSK
jgi:hypothetical protein